MAKRHVTSKRAQSPEPLTDDRVPTTAQLLERLPISRVQLWRMAREGRFPAPVRLTSARIGWRWSAILAWLRERERHPLDRRPYFPSDKDAPTETA